MVLLLALALSSGQPVHLAAAPRRPARVQPKKATESEAPSAAAAALLESCSAHKFETTVNVTVNGQPRQSKVKLCGKEGQSDADWLKTLQDAVSKVAANDRMPAEVKSQVVAALTTEIAAVSAKIARGGTSFSIGSPRPSAPPPAPRPAPAAPVEYSALPPMPTAPTVATPSLIPSRALILNRPRLTLRCLNPGDLAGESECTGLVRDTLLTIHADENLAPGVSLRFLRRGDDRGEISLAQLKKGQSYRTGLPEAVCRGVGGSRVTIDVLVKGAVADSLGPYDLRC